MNNIYTFLSKHYILYSFCIERNIFYMFLCIAELPLRLLSKIIMIYNLEIVTSLCKSNVTFVLFYLKLIKNPFNTSEK